MAGYIATLAPRPSAEFGPGDRTAAGGQLYSRACQSCHGGRGYLASKPNFAGIDLGGLNSTVVTNLTWDRIKRLRDTVKNL